MRLVSTMPTANAQDTTGDALRNVAGGADTNRPDAEDADERLRTALRRQIEQYPHDSRLRFELGESLHGSRRYSEAIAAYETCAALCGWDEEGAWACYRAADCHLEQGALHRAVESCAAGLTRHAGLPELPWLAAVA